MEKTSYIIHHTSYILAATLFSLLVLLFSGCKSVKSFLSRDLEDEDFIIGQLYADEVVKDTPVISGQRSAASGQNKNPLGLTYSDGDNMALYNAINSWLGVPYKYGGTDHNGIDCSAFVGVIYREVYRVNLSRTSNDMLKDVKLIPKSQLTEGNLVFFTNSKGKVSHVGIYLKEGLFAHASTSNGVSVSRLDDTYWKNHFYKGGKVK